MKSLSHPSRREPDPAKTIDLLNRLVKTHNDRMQGYQTASSETLEVELHAAFADFARSSHQCKQELTNEIVRLGGTVTEKTKFLGKIFRAWMDIKATLTGRDIAPVLDSCNTLEEMAFGTYQRVMRYRTDVLSTRQQAMLMVHIGHLKADHERLIYMRNVLVLAD